jgi:hypothetical protein
VYKFDASIKSLCDTFKAISEKELTLTFSSAPSKSEYVIVGRFQKLDFQITFINGRNPPILSGPWKQGARFGLSSIDDFCEFILTIWEEETKIEMAGIINQTRLTLTLWSTDVLLTIYLPWPMCKEVYNRYKML